MIRGMMEGSHTSITDSSDISAPLQAQTAPNEKCKRPVVYVTRRIPQVGVDILLKICDVKQWDSEQAVPRWELMYGVAGVYGILCMESDLIDASVLDSAGTQLQVVATMSHSAKHIDQEECHRRGIQVLTCPYQPIHLLAELTIALVLLTIKESQTEEEMLNSCKIPPPDIISSDRSDLNIRPRQLNRLVEEQLAFQWTNGKSGNNKCSTWKMIARKTFGVYGLTTLGVCVAEIMKNISDCDVFIADNDFSSEKFRENFSQTGCNFVSFDELLEKSDVICVCGSAGEKSVELFCKESFEKMKKDAILVASQSQEIAINYLDLYVALRERILKAVGLNDCNQEPVPFKTMLMGLQNCTFLPQTQESVYDMRHKVSVIIAKNLTKALNKNTTKVSVK